jgi:hypothetical protein
MEGLTAWTVLAAVADYAVERILFSRSPVVVDSAVFLALLDSSDC